MFPKIMSLVLQVDFLVFFGAVNMGPPLMEDLPDEFILVAIQSSLLVPVGGFLTDELRDPPQRCVIPPPVTHFIEVLETDVSLLAIKVIRFSRTPVLEATRGWDFWNV